MNNAVQARNTEGQKAATVVANILSGHVETHDISVEIGKPPRYNPENETIYLPAFPGTEMSEEAGDKLLGYLFHETAEAKLSTWAESDLLTDKEFRSGLRWLVNGINDARINLEFAEEYPGAGLILDRLSRHFYNKYRGKDEPHKPSIRMVGVVASWIGQGTATYGEVYGAFPGLQTAMNRVEEDLKNLDLSTEEAVVEQARQMYRKLKDLQPDRNQPDDPLNNTEIVLGNPPNNEDGDEDDDPIQDLSAPLQDAMDTEDDGEDKDEHQEKFEEMVKKIRGRGSGEEDDQDDSQGVGGEDDQDDSQGVGSDKTDDSGESPENRSQKRDQEGKCPDDSAFEADGKDEPATQKGGEDPWGAPLNGPHNPIPDMQDTDEADPFEKAIQEVADEIDNETGDVTYTFDPSDDTVRYASKRHGRSMSEDRYRRDAQVLANQLRRALSSAEHKRRKRRRQGRLDSSALDRAVMGDPSVFERTEIDRGEDVAVSLSFDRSGSMNGSPMKAVQYLTNVWNEAFGRLDMPLEILSWSTNRYAPNPGPIDGKQGVYRGHPIGHYIHKGYEEPHDSEEVLNRLYNIEAQGGTPTGEGLSFAARRLAQQNANRKVLFCMTDGRPSWGPPHIEYIRTVLDRCEKADIEVIGVGILHEDTHNLFDHWVQIRDTNNLDKGVTDQLVKTLQHTGKGR